MAAQDGDPQGPRAKPARHSAARCTTSRETPLTAPDEVRSAQERSDQWGRGVAWIIFPGDAVPPEFEERAWPARIVALLPRELGRLTGGCGASGSESRDEKILRLLAEGMTIASVARRLGLARRTVDRHLAELRKRTNVGSTAELAAWAARNGF